MGTRYPFEGLSLSVNSEKKKSLEELLERDASDLSRWEKAK